MLDVILYVYKPNKPEPFFSIQYNTETEAPLF